MISTASLDGTPVVVEIRDLDVVCSGNQNCLSCPQGIVPLTVSQRALKVIRVRKTKIVCLIRTSPHPDVWDDLDFRKKLLGEYNIEIAGAFVAQAYD